MVIEDPLPKQKKKRANSTAPTPAKADEKQENARRILRAAKRKPPAPVKVTPGSKSATTEYLFMADDASPRKAAVKRMADAGAKVPSVKRPRRVVLAWKIPYATTKTEIWKPR